MKAKHFLLASALLLWAGVLEAQTYQVPVSEKNEKMQEGEFEPTWESLQNYKVPEWFRNANLVFGHIGDRNVWKGPATGWRVLSIWKVRASISTMWNIMAIPLKWASRIYCLCLKPRNGIRTNWFPFIRRIGAQYFFALGNHHDNYDLWDSQYQEWNSVNIGPKKDILAGWAEAAKKNGLPFGISFHADHAWSWYESAQRYDRHGEKAGVPYDGCLTKEDGKGKWWEGYDPQKLYAQNHPLSAGSWADGMIHRQWAWGNGVCIPTQEYVTNFYDRTIDAINRYNPDLIYFDVTGVPFYPISDAGLKIAAHFYNHNMVARKGDFSAVMFGKILTDEQRKALVWDVERGSPNSIYEEPWQTCSCLGGWHYDTRLAENGWYKSASDVVKLLVDVISKNGNLLLSVPLRADGTFDEKEEAILNEFGDWMSMNKEAIYDTRPWKVFGEGPIANADIKINAQGFNEGAYTKATASEIRFTQTKKYLYATVLAWPEEKQVVIQSLATGSELYPDKITKIELLGYGKVFFTRTAQGVVIDMPDVQLNKIAPVFKIKK